MLSRGHFSPTYYPRSIQDQFVSGKMAPRNLATLPNKLGRLAFMDVLSAV